MDDETLLNLNRQGFIPGPEEKEGAFLERVRKTKAQIPAFRTDWDWARETVFELFDFFPDSLPIHISNQGLRIWEAAACWIEDGVPKVQLRETTIRKISKEELLAHEAIHAARAAFEESEFEEFFAFASAEKKWRRIFGPILRRPWEVWPFFIASLLSFTSLSVWPVVCLSIGALFRLYRSQAKLKAAAQFLSQRIGSERRIRAALFRLTDQEIGLLAKGVWPKGDLSLRWRLLRLAYFS